MHTETHDVDALINHTGDIVSSFVAHNSIEADKVPELITSVHAALAGLNSDEAKEEPREPAVSIRASVKPDKVTCLDCGRQMKMLKRHISTEHGLTPQEYRERWNLPADHPLVAPNYAEKRSELAREIGLGQDPKQKRGRRKKLSIKA